MNNQKLIDTTQENFKNEEFLKVFQEIFKVSSNEFAVALDEISAIYSSDLYWWISLTASRSSVKSSLYKEFCIVKSIKIFSALDKKKFIFLVSTISQKIVLKKILGEHCPEILIKRKKENIYPLLRSYIRPVYFFFNKALQLILIKLYLEKPKHNFLVTLAEIFLSPTENLDRYYPRLENFLDSQNTKNIFFVPTIINTNLLNFIKIIKDIKVSGNNYFFRESYISLGDLLDAVFYRRKLHDLKISKSQQEKLNRSDAVDLIFESLKNEPFNSLSAEGVLNFKFIKKLKCEKKIQILNFIDWWENTPMDKGLNLALNSFFPKATSRGYMGFVPSSFSFQLSPTKQEIYSKVVPNSIGVIGEAFLPILKRFDITANAFIAPAFRFEYLKRGFKKNKENFLVLPPIDPNESQHIIEIIVQTAEFFPNKNFIIKTHPGTGKLKKFQNSTNIKNIFFDNISSIDKLLGSAEILITSSSSAALEGIVQSIPALIFNYSRSLPESIIPELIPGHLWKSFNDTDNLIKQIKQFQLLDANTNAQNDNVNLSYYFNLPTKKNVHDFFLITDEKF